MKKEKLSIKDLKDGSTVLIINKTDTVEINHRNNQEFYLISNIKDDAIVGASLRLGWDLNGKYSERKPLPVKMNGNGLNYLHVKLDSDIFTIE